MSAQHHFFEVTSDGNLVQFGDTGLVSARLSRLMSLMSTRVDARGETRTDRFDLSMRLTHHYIDHAARVTLDEARAIRGDAFSPSLGMFNPRQLTQTLEGYLTERLPELSSERIFPLNSTVDPGAIQYEQYRTYGTGEAVVYRGGMGDDVPAVSIGMASLTQPIVWLVSRMQIDFLEGLRSNFAGFDTHARKMFYARRVIAEKSNVWCWEGSTANNLFGFLNHPYIDTAVSTVPYNEDSATDDILADFNYWAQRNYIDSSGTYKPDTVIFALETWNYLSSTFRSADNNLTLMEALQKANPHIKNWERAEGGELDDALSANVHGMVFMRRGDGGRFQRSCERVEAMPPTLLAPERRALGSDFFLVQAIGGLNHLHAGDELVVYVQGRP